MPKATATFEYDHAEHWGNGYFGFQDASGDFVAFVREDQSVTNRLKFAVRQENKVVLYQAINTEDIILHERPGPGNITLRIIDANNELLDTLTLQGALDLLYRKPAPALVPSETVPPTKPPVLDEWVVVNPGGMNIRSTPQVTSTNLVGEVPDGWTFNNNGIGATSTNYLWNYIYDGAFAGNWIAVERRSDGYRYCKLAMEIEPPATGTVQLTGAIRLETRPDGWTYLSGGEGNGFNMRYAATGRYNPDEYFDFIAGHGLKWVRVYFSQENHTLDQCLAKFKPVLDKAAARGLLICGVVTDSLGHSGMIIEEDRPWHTGGGIGHLNIDWIMSKQYEKDYFRFVEGFAEAFKDHPGLGMIDLVNEAGVYGVSPVELHHAQAYTEWLSESARLAYTASDGKVCIGFGGINTLHSRPPMKPLADHARDLIKACQYVQAWNVHIYSEKDYHPDALYRFEEDCINYDYVYAMLEGKAIFGSEIGSWYTNQDRPHATVKVLERNTMWSGAWYWGLALHSDNGEADAHAMALYRDGQGEFDGMMAALAA